MFELLTIVGLFAGLCVALYFTIKIFPVDLDADDRFEEKRKPRHNRSQQIEPVSKYPLSSKSLSLPE